ncbi:MAG: hypothetical protein JW716_05140 [Candidatus Aenigmarchaeota archaeon]|nr:hypothetical protein [Candidatus Aenigmarchaeota archaeon]
MAYKLFFWDLDPESIYSYLSLEYVYYGLFAVFCVFLFYYIIKQKGLIKEIKVYMKSHYPKKFEDLDLHVPVMGGRMTHRRHFMISAIERDSKLLPHDMFLDKKYMEYKRLNMRFIVLMIFFFGLVMSRWFLF